MASTTHRRQFIVRGENKMRKLSYLFMALSLLCFAVPAFAQGAEAAGTNWVAITAGFSMAIASGLWALGPAEATGPAARPGIQLALILGLALIESLALYTLAIIIVKVK